MPLTTGSRIGAFEITSPLGKGGMGVVFRARDTRLGRQVALKVLPDEFANDRDRLSRFRREAQVLASLNHPSIAHIYGLEQSDDTQCIVMELVEGETLWARLKRGRPRLDEAVRIGRQMAQALEAAHQKGITHRDLKPSNVMLLPSGDVKVLDFGLAKVREEDGSEQADSPTMLTASTPGLILGTAAYISPEQIGGKAADAQSDIWSFGCVLYELLTGELAFAGDTTTEILGSVLKTEPDWAALPKTPPLVTFVVRRSLEKDPKRRLRDISDVRIALDEAASVTKAESAAAPPPPREMRLEVNTPPTVDRVSLAVSPDGQKIVFTANPQGRPRLWLRALDSTAARPLEGTDYAIFPFWSPDSRSVGFFADSKLKRVNLDGGIVQALANAPLGRGGTWHRDGTILFAPTPGGPLFRVSSHGGEAVPLTTMPSMRQWTCRAPQFLPDTHAFLFYVAGASDFRGVYTADLDGSDPRRLLDADSSATYAASGHLLFVRKGTLLAQAFDPAKREVTGAPFPVAEHVTVDATMSAGAFSASPAGPIVFRTGAAAGQRQFVWFDRAGKEIGKVGDPDGANPVNPALSPDGRRVALQRTVNGQQDIWILEVGRGILTRFTFDPANHVTPSWSPDGKHIVYSSNCGGGYDIYRKAVSGGEAEELLLATPDAKGITDVSSDGRFTVYRNIDPITGYDIRVLPLDGDGEPMIFVQNHFEERDAQFSPDGNWIAYQSNESGRFEIYVRPFPGPADKCQVSLDGGTQVRWRRDGEELFYIGLDGRLMAVPMRLDPGSQYVDVDSPVALFPTRIGGAVQSNYRQQYAVTPDGQRFLMNTVTQEAGAPITIILNWKARP